MALAALFDDYLPVCTSERRRNFGRRNRPLVLNLLNLLEDEMDQTIGQVVRRLPAALQDLEDHYENSGRKRKRKSDAVSSYEPKTKVQVVAKDGKFQVQMDTSNYQPDEIMVKVADDKLTVSAKHETKANYVYEYHEFTRSFELPEGVDPQTVTSRLNAAGQLTIEAPMKPSKDQVAERVVPVKMVKDSPTVDIADESKEAPTQNNESK